MADGVVDLVTVAQALHWFDLTAFYGEVRRVLRPSRGLAVCCYGRCEPDDPSLGSLLARFYEETVGPCWPAERRLVEAGYRDLPFPFEEVVTPAFEMTADFTLPMLVGHLGTWSAVQRYREATGRDPLPDLTREIRAIGEKAAYRVRGPIALRAGRATGSAPTGPRNDDGP